MSEGTIKKLTDKAFGLIDTGNDNDIFSTRQTSKGWSYEELQEGQRVSYTEGTEGSGPKGPRAENVKPV